MILLSGKSVNELTIGMNKSDAETLLYIINSLADYEGDEPVVLTAIREATAALESGVDKPSPVPYEFDNSQIWMCGNGHENDGPGLCLHPMESGGACHLFSAKTRSK